jgi:hypothetical protein
LNNKKNYFQFNKTIQSTTNFNHSESETNPSVGGSTLDVEGEKYFFASLAFEFYYSGELNKVFLFE